MSKGSPIVPVRIPTSLLETIDAEIAKVNLHWNVIPYTRSTWIIAAIKDKLKHANRSRKAGRTNKKKLDNSEASTINSEYDAEPTSQDDS